MAPNNPYHHSHVNAKETYSSKRCFNHVPILPHQYIRTGGLTQSYIYNNKNTFINLLLLFTIVFDIYIMEKWQQPHQDKCKICTEDFITLDSTMNDEIYKENKILCSIRNINTHFICDTKLVSCFFQHIRFARTRRTHLRSRANGNALR